jgi:phospholipid transport system substrate-binding protein
VIALVVMVIAAVPWAPVRAADDGPEVVVERLHETLLGVMKEATVLGYQGRYSRIAPALQASFDFEFMARFVLGSGWKGLSESQQTAWTDAFVRITTATYASRFKGYGGEQFKTLGQDPAAQDTVFVRTVVDRPDADDVELTYRVRKTDQGWRIIDIYQKGTVSELALRRSEFSGVLKREGFDKLLEVVNAKIADYADGKDEPAE